MIDEENAHHAIGDGHFLHQKQLHASHFEPGSRSGNLKHSVQHRSMILGNSTSRGFRSGVKASSTIPWAIFPSSPRSVLPYLQIIRL